jgi:hypothetical protein
MDARQILESDLLWGKYPQNRNCSLASIPQLPSGQESWHTEGGSLFATGLCEIQFAQNGTLTDLLAAADRLDNITDPASEWTGPNHRLRLMLQAFAIHHHVAPSDWLPSDRNGSLSAAVWQLIDEAVRLEDEAVVSASGPTIAFLSAHEFAAQMLLIEADPSKAQLALSHFQEARLLAGNRLSILLGEARVAWLAGCPKMAQEKYSAVQGMLAANLTDATGPLFLHEMTRRSQSVPKEARNCSLQSQTYSFGSILQPSLVLLSLLWFGC